MTIADIPFASMFLAPEAVSVPSSVLLYGPAGTRKTSIAGTIAKTPRFKGKRILFIDIDRGAGVLGNDPEVREAIEAGTFNILQIDKLDPTAFGKLQYFLGAYDENDEFQQGEAFKYGYDVVILDSLDVAQDVAKEWYLANTMNDKGTARDSRKAWGEIGRWTNNVAWAFQNSETFGILVMHATDDAEDTGSVTTKPKLAGGAKDNIASIPDLVAYLEFKANPEDKDDVRLVATIGSTPGVVSKNRWMLPNHFIDFDMPSFFEAIEARKTQQAPAQVAA